MGTDIKNFISGISEKTGVEIAVYLEGGQFVCGNADVKPSIFPEKSQSIVQGNNVTCFFFKYKNVDYVGAIEGDGNSQRVYACLIAELAVNLNNKEWEMNKESFCSSVLFGELDADQTERSLKKHAIKDSPAFVMIITANEDVLPSVKGLLSNFTSETQDFVVEVDKRQLAFVKFVEEDSLDLHSSTEYAEFIQQSIFEEVGSPIHVSIGGTVKSFVDVNSSFKQALSCAKTSEIFGGNVNVHSYKQFVLVKMIEGLSKDKLEEYLKVLIEDIDMEVFNDAEMVDTADEFLESSLNVSETARKLYLHRNTLIYRLDKIEKETGLNIRRFSDAITFRLISLLSKLVR